MDLAQQLRDLAMREADTMPPGWKDAYWLYRAAADRIEADAKRLAELERMLVVCEECGLAIEEDAVEQRARADAAEARVKVLEDALREIAYMKPHHAGQTANEYHMQQIAIAALEGEK